jgi:S-DNA-T family DNA segregation ATPase FtsK/SpoIIIE
MSAIDRTLDSLTFLSDGLRDALRRRLREICGLALIVLAMLLAVALATWSVQDPSLSHATRAPVRNLLGAPGAVVADVLMQLLGVDAIALVLPVAVWGWRLVTHRPLHRERIRVAIWIVAVLLAAGCIACLPHGAAWPLPAGLGGVIGDALLRFVMLIAGDPLPAQTQIALGVVTGIGALLALSIASGYGWHRQSDTQEDKNAVKEQPAEDVERASISLGWIVHALLSLKARLGRVLARRRSTRFERGRGAGTAGADGAPLRALPGRARRSRTRGRGRR